MPTKNWIVKGLIPEQHIVLVTGQPGNGKSWWVQSLAIDCASGSSHLGEFDCVKCYVIDIDEDTPKDVFSSRLDRLACGVGLQVKDLDIEIHSLTGFRLYDEKCRQFLKNNIANLVSRGFKVLVIIDSLIRTMAGQSLDTIEKATKVMSYLLDFRDAGATLLIVHHITTKKDVNLQEFNPNKLAGLVLNSTALISSCDTAFVVCRLPIPSPTLFTIIPHERRTSLLVRSPFSVELREEKNNSFPKWANLVLLEETPAYSSSHERTVFKYFVDSKVFFQVSKLRSLLGEDLTLQELQKALRTLEEQKCVIKVMTPTAQKNTCVYKRHPDFDILGTFYKDSLVI